MSIRTVETTGSRVRIGPGALREVPAEVERIGADRAFLIATPSSRVIGDDLAALLGRRLTGRFDRPVAHTPVAVTDDVLHLVGPAEVVVAVGGGSAVGLAKALSARTGLPQIAVPTTYAGSEVTPVLGETDDGVKRTRRDPALRPGTVIYDPELTLSMPVGLSCSSALNALAHAVETLWAPDATPLSDALATESAAAILTSLPDVAARPDALPPRARLQEGAWLAGLCLSHAQMGLHHQLAHVLGGTFALPHADLHAVLLPHVMAFMLPAVPGAASRLESIVQDNPTTVVVNLLVTHGRPRTLKDIGVPAESLPAITDQVLAQPYPSRLHLTREPLLALLTRAWG